ncbi:MAG: LCP family protein [Tissierellia bacterium]|nr:LCP family protein [Tissierellia bacterium]
MKIFKNVLKFIALIIVFVLLWYFGSIWYYNQVNGDDKKNAIANEEIDINKISDNNEIGQRVDGEILFLLAGTDKSVGEEGSTRTDTLILVKMNLKEGKIDLVSIPRDTRVPVNGNLDKINHASSYGGIELTMKTIRDWLDIDLDYYAVINFDSVVHIVDIIGGVEVDVPEAIAEELKIEPGVQKLNGEQALTFVRHRKSYMTGDIGRVQTQQLFMKALLGEIIKPINLLKLPNIINASKKELTTNLKISQGLPNILSLGKMASPKIESDMIPGDGDYIGGISYYVYDREATISLRDRYFKDYRLNEKNLVEDYY